MHKPRAAGVGEIEAVVPADREYRQQAAVVLGLVDYMGFGTRWDPS